MPIAKSKVEAEIVGSRRGQSSTSDLRRAAFPEGKPTKRSLADLKEGVRRRVRSRRARR